MAKRLREHVKYTVKELDQYVQTEGSCVRKVNTNMHLSIGPFSLTDFKHILMAHIVRSKVGFYDVHLDGIVLDVKKVKILGTTGAMRADDPRIHVNINADVYLFQPTEGSELSGVVKHIGAHHIGVVLYRVFNVNLRVCHKVDKEEVQMDQNVKFRIRNYNLQNIFPYVDGELLNASGEAVIPKTKKIVFNDMDNADSGIEVKEEVQELDELLSLIKTEVSEEEIAKKSKKHQKKSVGNMESLDSDKSAKKVKKTSLPKNDELLSAAKGGTNDECDIVTPSKKSVKRSRKSTEGSTTSDSAPQEKLAKKKKESISDNIDSPSNGYPLTPQKIKKEAEYSGDEQTPKTVTKEKRDKPSKTKTKDSPEKLEQIKQEFYVFDD